MIVKRSCACDRCASEREVSGNEANAITDALLVGIGGTSDDLSQSIPNTTRNYQEITTSNFVIYTECPYSHHLFAATNRLAGGCHVIGCLLDIPTGALAHSGFRLVYRMNALYNLLTLYR
jgi:hypothetical protein